MNLVFAFLGGMFLTNGVPHFVSGIKGKTHMTPFAKNSSAYVNVIWAYANFLLGLWLFGLSMGTLQELVSFDGLALSFWAGSLFMTLADAWLFSNPNASFPWFKK